MNINRGGNNVTCKTWKKKEGRGDDTWAWLERDSKGVDTNDMNRARQHHEECNTHGDYDEMQNDKRHNAM